MKLADYGPHMGTTLPNYPLTFSGHDLWCKGGFQDGDILDDYIYDVPALEAIWDRAYDEKRTTTFCKFCLLAVVEFYLLPLFDRPLNLHFASYVHNGARVTDEEWWDVNVWPPHPLPEIVLGGAEILPLMFGMAKAFERGSTEQQSWSSRHSSHRRRGR